MAGVMQGFIDGVTYKLPMQNATDFARIATRDSITKKHLKAPLRRILKTDL